MRRIAALLAGLAAGAILPAAADAQSVTAGGSITGRIGYGSNPYLNVNSPGGSGIGGGDASVWIQRRSETARTRLTGTVDIDQNFQYYGRVENYIARIDHQQTISDKLSLTGNLHYSDSINPRNLFEPGSSSIDLLSIGQRTRSFGGDANLQWTPTSRDSFYIGPNFSLARYPNQSANSFDQYGVRGGYLRQVTEKLKLGFDGSVSRLNSRSYADSTSYQGGLRLVYDFSPIWQFDGGVSLIHQVSSPGGSSSTVGFNANLCGKYPRYRICFDASRQSAPSGFGGLRTDNRFGVHGDYDLTSRSSLRFGAIYDISQSLGSPTLGAPTVPTQRFWEISGGYSRTITQRLSAGFSGRYQGRDFGSLVQGAASSVTGYSGTLDVTYKFGRIE